MPTFKDTNGREWRIHLDAPTIREIRNTFDGLNLIDAEGRCFAQLAGDPVTLVDVLWCLCRDQAQAAGVTDVQFGRALMGEAIEQATEALLNAILDFFPPRKRGALRAVYERTREIEARGTELALAKIQDPLLTAKLIGAMEAQMDAELAGLLTRLSPATSSPASSESAPAD